MHKRLSGFTSICDSVRNHFVPDLPRSHLLNRLLTLFGWILILLTMVSLFSASRWGCRSPFLDWVIDTALRSPPLRCIFGTLLLTRIHLRAINLILISDGCSLLHNPRGVLFPNFLIASTQVSSPLLQPLILHLFFDEKFVLLTLFVPDVLLDNFVHSQLIDMSPGRWLLICLCKCCRLRLHYSGLTSGLLIFHNYGLELWLLVSKCLQLLSIRGPRLWLWVSFAFLWAFMDLIRGRHSRAPSPSPKPIPLRQISVINNLFLHCR